MIAERTLIVLVVAAFAGCDSGHGTFQRSGTITFDGQPIPAGEIRFEPDRSQGNTGPGAVGIVDGGKFRTAKGTHGGPHRMRITAFDGIALDGPEADAYPHGKPLFVDFEVIVDLPAHASSHDLDVPKSASHSQSSGAP